ncbi:hypothetical protein SKAU_G00333060 [Synaphobranchus kaupii]|uniref:Glycine N-methyltransferase n=1 Tax=Synaphobranchus kaupii TaxID=118154 RepID=A0A9Q1ELH4_SYNKA|nr:hypothetical protein SKAU_G00333060 [Synaphobranchus kaupii]
MITLDYTIQVPNHQGQESTTELSKFRLSYYPHRLDNFKELLRDAFDGRLQHTVYGDFQSYTPGQTQAPCYFIHVVQKTA